MYILPAKKSEEEWLGGLFTRSSAPNIEISAINARHHIDGVTSVEADSFLVKMSEVLFQEWYGCSFGYGVVRAFEEIKSTEPYSLGDFRKARIIFTVIPDKTLSGHEMQVPSVLYDFLFNQALKLSMKLIPIKTEIMACTSVSFEVSTDGLIEVRTKVLENIIREKLLMMTVASSFIRRFQITHENITAQISSCSFGFIGKETTIRLFAGKDIKLNRIDHESDDLIILPKIQHLTSSQIRELIIEPSILEPVNTDYLSIPVQRKTQSFDFTQLKIGGLHSQLEFIAEAIRPRGVDSEHLEQLGMDEYERGILLYGPPGTGKTTIARELSKILGINATSAQHPSDVTSSDFKIINGPEILSKYVGQSEENIRKIFYSSSSLNIVFFDEFDAIARARGSGGASERVSDSIVTQLLSIMDGVHENKNTLVIAATNRIDIIDQAFLRPGRFGLKLYIGLPDKEARREIFQIHLMKNITNGSLSADVDLDELSSLSHNYSGAEIKGICKKARELALAKAAPDMSNLDKVNCSELVLKRDYFIQAFSMVKSMLQGDLSEYKRLFPEDLRIKYPDDSRERVVSEICTYCIKSQVGTKVCIIEGEPKSGKSAVCGQLLARLQNQVDMVRVIVPGKDLVFELNKIAGEIENKKNLIIIDGFEVLAGILNVNSYSSKAINEFTTFISRALPGQNMVIVTMRSAAKEIYERINPSYYWNVEFKL
jgi:ATP-dependent 26S proteasome regulatory subunit